jgi:hypothetical protein
MVELEERFYDGTHRPVLNHMDRLQHPLLYTGETRCLVRGHQLECAHSLPITFLAGAPGIIDIFHDQRLKRVRHEKVESIHC